MTHRRGSKKKPKKPDPALGRTFDVEIERIGKSGDGIASYDGRPVYVPLALPGDRLTVRFTETRGDGYAAAIVDSADLMPRRTPACRHFGTCGGCRLQHLPVPLYRDWKQAQIGTALRARGIEGVDIRPLIEGEPGSRRRLRLAFVRTGDRVILGHRKRAHRDIVAITECPIAHPDIVALLDPLKTALASLDMAKPGGEVAMTSAETGLDLLIDSEAEPTLEDRETLAALAEQLDLARVAWRPDARSEAEPIAARRDVMIRFDSVQAALPQGSFLQATEAAERAIVNAVRAAIQVQGRAGRVADLFSGAGAIGLPLAADGWRVLAFERDAAMVRTLNDAAHRAGLAGRITAKSRDLDQDPLTGNDLADFDALILDPPRAGARSQIEAIAAARSAPAIAMASCNPATFARDARTLIDAGYRLTWVQPIDAFLHSAEIELVAAFNRPETP